MKKLILLSIIIGLFSCEKEEITPKEKELSLINTKWESYDEVQNRRETLHFKKDSLDFTIVTNIFNATLEGSCELRNDSLFFNDDLLFVILKYSNDTLYTNRKPCANFIRVK